MYRYGINDVPKLYMPMYRNWPCGIYMYRRRPPLYRNGFYR